MELLSPIRFSLWLSKGVIKVRVLNINGVDKPIPIETGGHFRVFTRILQYSSISDRLDSLDEVMTLSESPSVVLNAKGRIEELPHRQTSLDNSLNIQMTKYLSRNWDEEVGRLVLRIQPLDFPYGNFFKQFEGIYDLDLLTSLHKSNFKATANPFETKIYVSKDNNTNFFDKEFTSAYIKNGKFIEETKVSSLNDGAERRKGFQKYDFSDMKPSFEEVLRGESLTTRGIGFRVKTCLTSKFNGARPPLGEPFQVVVKSRRTHEKTVYNLKIKGGDRCLNFVHKFWFKHFKPEILFFFDFSVREVASNQMVEESLGISVNPWDEGWTFGRDIIHLSEDYIREVTEMQKIPPRFFLPSFSYYTLRFRYAIDQFLNLKVKKSILLHLKPMMVRYNSRRQGRFGVYKLRDGIYLMKAALEKKYLDPTQGVTTAIYTGDGADNDRLAAQEVLSGGDLSKIHHLSVVKRLVRVIDGQIIAPVEFIVQDLRIMRIRAQLMVQLEPVEEWRHYMVKLYNDFYERLEGELRRTSVISFDTFDLLNKEKIRNIKKIVDSMTLHERRVHDLIDRKFKEEKRREKMYKVTYESGQVIEYRGCYGMPEITWDKIFDEFDLDHPELDQFFSTSLSDKDRSLVFNPKKIHLSEEEHEEAESDEERKRRMERTRWAKPKEYYGLSIVQGLSNHESGENQYCYTPYNVVHPLILNDFVGVSLEPIPRIDLNEFVDSEKSSGLKRETFFGPVTFLLNGNSSSMRSTENIAEFTCQDIDCDHEKAEEAYQKEMEKLSLKLRAEGENIESLSSVYDHSPYFNSMRYLNNSHVDELIEKVHEQNRVYKVVGEAISQIYYYLREYKLNFLSLADEDLYRVNMSLCKGQESKLKTIEPCLESVDDYKMSWDIFPTDRTVEEVKSDFEDFVNDLSISEPLSLEICKYFFLQALGEEKQNHDLEGKSESYANGTSVTLLRYLYGRCHSQMSLTTEQINMCKETHPVKKDRLICESEKRYKNRSGVLNIERKIRVKETNLYFAKGGKSQNINVGASFTSDYRESLSQSWSLGFGVKTSPFFADLKRSGSQSNTKGNGVTIGEQTYLVMQDATMDIQLTDYIRCVSISLNPAELQSADILGQIKRIAKSDVTRSIRDGLFLEEKKSSELEKKVEKMLRGLLVCSARESDKEDPKPMAIREHYYYYTQHFTDGDMLDPANLYNHPWLIKIRGKTDMLKFLDRIKARKVNLSDNGNGIKLRGNVVDEGMWPIKQLVSAYSGVISTFPGIYTMLHNEHEYEISYPSSDNPSDSFEKDFLCRISDWINSDICTLSSKNGESSLVIQGDSSVIQGDSSVIQGDSSVTQDKDSVTPDEDPVTPDEDPVTPDEDLVTPDDSPFDQWIESLNN